MTFSRSSTITFLAIFSLLAIFFSSCTITQRRYRSGFHLEWKHRYKPQESDQVSSVKDVVASVELVDTGNSVVHEITSIRPVENTLLIQNITEEIEQNIHQKSKLPDLPLKLKERSRLNPSFEISPDPDNEEKKRNGFVEFLLSFLMSIAIFVVPPILFTIVADYLSYSKFKLGLFWFVWVAGIVASILLFSSLWPIIFACIIWNLLYLLLGAIIILATA